MDDKILQVQNVDAGYGKLQILNDMSFNVKRNSITAILGGNGCGKSTTLKAITGMINVTNGKIIFNGESLLSIKPNAVVRKGIAYVTQGKDVFPSMTVEENLLLGSYSIRDRAKINQNLEMVLEKIPRLKTRLKSPSGVLSGGEQQMLSIGRGLMSNPKLLILDEPSAALSPKIAQEIYDFVQQIHNEGVTVLLVEQNVKAALEIADYVYILSEGAVVFEDTPANIKRHPDIKQFYLGKLPIE